MTTPTLTELAKIALANNRARGIDGWISVPAGKQPEIVKSDGTREPMEPRR